MIGFVIAYKNVGSIDYIFGKIKSLASFFIHFPSFFQRDQCPKILNFFTISTAGGGIIRISLIDMPYPFPSECWMFILIILFSFSFSFSFAFFFFLFVFSVMIVLITDITAVITNKFKIVELNVLLIPVHLRENM